MASNMAWTAEMIGRLRELWADKCLSAAEIGRQMRLSKNAILGKAHRLGLPPRPSPIRPVGSWQQPKRRGVWPPVPKLAPLPSAMAPALVQPGPAPTVRASSPTLVSVGPVTTCCYPVGDVGTPTFHFCEATVLPGSPYCREHDQLCYVRVRQREDVV